MPFGAPRPAGFGHGFALKVSTGWMLIRVDIYQRPHVSSARFPKQTPRMMSGNVVAYPFSVFERVPAHVFGNYLINNAITFLILIVVKIARSQRAGSSGHETRRGGLRVLFDPHQLDPLRIQGVAKVVVSGRVARVRKCRDSQNTCALCAARLLGACNGGEKSVAGVADH